jgi:hypothetical protein
MRIADCGAPTVTVCCIYWARNTNNPHTQTLHNARPRTCDDSTIRSVRATMDSITAPRSSASRCTSSMMSNRTCNDPVCGVRHVVPHNAQTQVRGCPCARLLHERPLAGLARDHIPLLRGRNNNLAGDKNACAGVVCVRNVCRLQKRADARTCASNLRRRDFPARELHVACDGQREVMSINDVCARPRATVPVSSRTESPSGCSRRENVATTSCARAFIGAT